MTNTVNVDLNFQAKGQGNVKSAFDQAAAGAQKLEQSADQAAASVDRLDQKLDNAASSGGKLNASAGGSSGGRLSALGTVGGIGSQLLGGLGAGELANVAGLVGDSAGALEFLGDKAGLLGVSALGAAAVVAAWTAVNRENSRAIEAIIATQAEYYQLIKTSTTAQLEAAIEQKRQEIEITQARVDENRRIFQQFEAQAGGVGRALADALDAGGVRRLREETQKLEDQLRSESFLLGRLESALANNATATNDMTAAENQLADARVVQFERIADSYLRADSMTQEQRTKLIEQNNSHIAILQRLQTEYEGNAEITAKITDRIATLSEESLRLATVTESMADKEAALTRARDTAKARTDALFEAQTKQTDAQTALRAAELELARVRTENAERMVVIAAERDKRIAEIEQGRKDAAVEAAAELKQLEADSAEAIKRIRSDSSDDIESALRKGNVVAAREAREAAEDAIQTAEQQTSKEQVQIEKRLQQAEIAAARETALAIATAEEKFAEEQKRSAAEIKTRQDAYNQAQVDLQNAMFALNAIQATGNTLQQSAASQHQSNLLGITQQGGAAIAGVWSDVMYQLQNQMLSLLGSARGGGGSAGLGGGRSGGGAAGLGGGRSGGGSAGLGGGGSGLVSTRFGAVPMPRQNAALGGGDTQISLAFDFSGSSAVDIPAITRSVERQVVPKITAAIKAVKN